MVSDASRLLKASEVCGDLGIKVHLAPVDPQGPVPPAVKAGRRCQQMAQPGGRGPHGRPAARVGDY